MCSPIISIRPPPNRCGELRPEPPFLAMVMPAPASRYGTLWHAPQELAWPRSIIRVAPSGRSRPSSLPASPYTPSRSRKLRWNRLRPQW